MVKRQLSTTMSWGVVLTQFVGVASLFWAPLACLTARVVWQQPLSMRHIKVWENLESKPRSLPRFTRDTVPDNDRHNSLNHLCTEVLGASIYEGHELVNIRSSAPLIHSLSQVRGLCVVRDTTATSGFKLVTQCIRPLMHQSSIVHKKNKTMVCVCVFFPAFGL